jgi:hypothetical protein
MEYKECQEEWCRKCKWGNGICTSRRDLPKNKVIRRIKMELENQTIEVYRDDIWQLASMEDLKPGETFRIKPLPKKFKYKEYLHGSKGNNHERACQLGLENNEEFMQKFAYSLYEVNFDMEVDVQTGETWILAVNGVELKEPVKG